MSVMVETEKLIDACRVPETVPSGTFGPWKISRHFVADTLARGFFGFRPYNYMTILSRMTMATMHERDGEVVMEDSPRELRRHLPILLAARGNILVSGLGLGCVVRGLLSKPAVRHIDVVEIDSHILHHVGQEFQNKRVTLHHGNAETIPWPDGKRWDFAWHDVWSEEENLSIVHARLMLRYKKMCNRQGAWMMPRWSKRLMKGSRILK